MVESQEVTRVAAVTGASSGIGAAIARVLSEEGYVVALGSRGIEDLPTSVVSKTHVPINVDVRVAESVEAFAAQILESFGTVDVVVANAGIGQKAPIVEFDPRTFEDVLRVNTVGVWHTMRAFCPALIASNGLMVVVTSDLSTRVMADNGAYTASKAATRALVRTFQIEHPRLRVLELRPGATDTNLGGDEAIEARRGWSLDPSDVAEVVRFASRLPAHVRLEEVVVRSVDQSPAY